jgi:hypothetical protein
MCVRPRRHGAFVMRLSVEEILDQFKAFGHLSALPANRVAEVIAGEELDRPRAFDSQITVNKATSSAGSSTSSSIVRSTAWVAPKGCWRPCSTSPCRCRTTTYMFSVRCCHGGPPPRVRPLAVLEARDPEWRGAGCRGTPRECAA